MTVSSPGLADLNGDGALDIVFGAGKDRLRPEGGRFVFSGQPEIAGRVVAVSGATNELLWNVPHPGEAFTTPRFIELNGDGVADVVMGGREGAFSALSGATGEVLWRIAPADVATTPVPYNFFTPAFIRDADGDGIADLVVVYSGNDTRLPGEPRDPGYVAVISGASGRVMHVHASPDGSEMYSSVVVYERPGGAEWLVFGTGGETHGGAAYRAPCASLLDGTFAAQTERLVSPGAGKGVIAPATIVEITGDDDPDIVVSTFDGRLVLVDGASGKPIWEANAEGEETYHGPAVLRMARDGRLGFFVSRGIGIFPRYSGSTHRLYDAADGRILYEYRDPFHPAGAPVAVDLTGDGIDEPFFFSMRFPAAQGARIHVLFGDPAELIVHDVATNFASTPVIADPRATGTLELIGLSWSTTQNAGTQEDWSRLRWQLSRMNLGAASPVFRSWAAYMGTATDGRYHAPAARNGR